MNKATTTSQDVRTYRIEVDTAAMAATLFIEVRGRDRLLEVRDLVRSLLEDHQLVGILEDKVADAAATAATAGETDQMPGVCIARGIAPTPGEDGSLKWLGEFFDSRAITMPDGSVDHYHHTRCSVYEGQPLVEIVPPTAGVPGMDVYGNELPATPGHPAPLQADAGVEREAENEEVFIAARGGQVEYNNGRLGVSELLTVKEVDYSVGSIDFDGAVEVHGDVGARFEVRGGASVQIQGSVENAEIESDRQVEIRGSVLGRGDALLVSGANMILSCVREAEIHCGGTLIVQRELLWCQAEVYEDLCVEHGRIVGGQVKVGGKVIAAELGSREEVLTQIQLGEAPQSSRALKRLFRERRHSHGRLQEFVRRHAGKLDRADGGPYTDTEREGHLKRRSALRAIARRARRREMILRKRLQRRRRASGLMITGTIHAGVEVSFVDNQLIHRFDETVKGPVKVGLDESGKSLQVEKI
jgi:uncharacterized protein